MPKDKPPVYLLRIEHQEAIEYKKQPTIRLMSGSRRGMRRVPYSEIVSIDNPILTRIALMAEYVVELHVPLHHPIHVVSLCSSALHTEIWLTTATKKQDGYLITSLHEL